MKQVITGAGGYSIMEVLMALVIFSVALLALNSVSLRIIGGNAESRHHTTAVLLAQQTIEDLRTRTFDLGSDGLLGTTDDDLYAYLADCTGKSNAYTANADLYYNADYAATLDANGNETGITSCPGSSVPVSNHLTRTWTIKDNQPVTGLKTLAVVVGWKEAGYTRFVNITTTLAEKD